MKASPILTVAISESMAEMREDPRDGTLYDAKDGLSYSAREALTEWRPGGGRWRLVTRQLDGVTNRESSL